MTFYGRRHLRRAFLRGLSWPLACGTRSLATVPDFDCCILVLEGTAVSSRVVLNPWISALKAHELKVQGAWNEAHERKCQGLRHPTLWSCADDGVLGPSRKTADGGKQEGFERRQRAGPRS